MKKKKIGQYEIGKLLGEGGIGQVHAAFDTVLQRNVAIKSLRPELLSDTNFVDRFRAEATSLARLNHPNITTLYSLIPDGRNLYMVMELVRGHTVDDILKKRDAPLDVRECLAIIAQAADGLGYAHSMGVIHRDIKPSNLMVSENGVLKIMDFGIARVRGSQRLTRSGSIVGTLAYMAPEQLRGEEGDESCDLYSLAIVLYEMMSGAPPFSATSEYDLMQAQINNRPDRLIPRVSGLEPQVEAALLKALSKKPAQRFPSTRAFSDALGATTLRIDAPKILHNDTRLLEPPDLSVRPPPPTSRWGNLAAMLPTRAWSALPPDMRAVVAGGGGALVVALAIIAFLFFPSSPRRPPTTVAVAPAVTPPPAVKPPGTPLAPAPNPQKTPQPPASSVTAPPGSDAASTPSSPLTELIAAADRGDPAAQNALGVKYALGEDGLPRDDTKAVEWYQKSARQGYAKAESNLGDMYYFGRGGLDKSYQEALSWYLKAAQQEFPDAQFRLGFMYEKGLGTDKDIVGAVRFYRSAANGGYAEAQNLIGILYATGSDGVAQDDKEAVTWYQKAADQNFAKAQKNLGDMYFFGRGVDRDYKQAVTWYTKASDQQFADAQFRLGYMFEKGLGMDAPNAQTAMELYQKAAHNGSVEAQRALDRLRASLGSDQ
jgi:serine/threonine-protein kinase